MKKLQLTHSDFHDIVVDPKREQLTDALRLYLNEGFAIVITESVAPFEVKECITTEQMFNTWFGSPDEE